MNILAIEAATRCCSLALWRGELICERFDNSGQQAGNIILGMIDEMLSSSHTRWSDIDVIAFGHGPGAFTGLRVATGLVQGLALGNNLPVYGVSVLASIAREAMNVANERDLSPQALLVAQDARMGELYWSSYRVDNNQFSQVEPDQLGHAGDVSLHSEQTYLVAGTGHIFSDDIKKSNPTVELQWLEDVHPHARSVASLTAEALQSGEKPVNAEDVKPVYLRNQVAKKGK